MKKIFLSVLLSFFTMIISSQTQTYVPSIENFANPERGLYKYTTTEATTYDKLSQTTLTNLRVNNKITLIWRKFDLSSFKTTTISSAYLTNMQSDFTVMRNAGVKCIVRFTYTNSSSDHADATKAIILQHINQLKPILLANEDVISSLEAGFIGSYGEWYYSDNFGTENLTATQLADRKEVGLAIMTLCPNRMVAFRTPYIQQQIAGTTPITAAEAYNGSIKSRTAAHNDCYLSSSSDYGTYRNDADRTYLEQQSKYTFDGGEVCNLTVYDSCANFKTQSQRFHFNYLNIDYNKTVWDDLKRTGQGCYDEVVRSLGYRFEVVSSDITNNILTLKIKNVGFANVFNERKVYLIFKNTATGQQASSPLNTDIRLWDRGTTTTITYDLSSMTGSYALYLWSPDLSTPLQTRNEYSIRFANENMWDPTTGFNNLNRTYTSGGPIVVVPPSNLSYPSPNAYVYNVAIPALTPSVVGNVTNYSISPALPSNLVLNPTTGVISGIPSIVKPTTTYTVTASNAGGSTSFSLVITVNDTPTGAVSVSVVNNKTLVVNNLKTPYSIRVYDMAGRLKAVTTDISRLKSGVYVVKITKSGITYTFKIVKA